MEQLLLAEAPLCSLLRFGFCFVETVSGVWCGCLQGGETLSVQRQQLEELYSAHSGSLSILMEAGDANGRHQDFPEGPANFTLLWYRRRSDTHLGCGGTSLGSGLLAAGLLLEVLTPPGWSRPSPCATGLVGGFLEDAPPSPRRLLQLWALGGPPWSPAPQRSPGAVGPSSGLERPSGEEGRRLQGNLPAVHLPAEV